MTIIRNVIFAFINKHRSGLFSVIPVNQTPVVCFADMRCSPKKTSTERALFFHLLLVLVLPSVATATDDIDLLDLDQEYDLSSEGRILSNEVINGNSSLLLGLQTTLNGVYDYIGW